MTTAPAGIDPRTRMGPVTLAVSDLQRLSDYYWSIIGLHPLRSGGGSAELGTRAGETLLVLHEDKGARAAPANAAGLYHTAFLLPSRKDLARWVQHVANLDLRVGAGDHLVSEAFYLSDPDGNGIEVYADRPRSQWRTNGKSIAMDTLAVDVPNLLREIDPTTPAWDGVPDGTTVGHVHLKITDPAGSRAFYEGIVGFDVVNETYPGALFVSAGGYHHHLGMNTWHTRGGHPAPGGTLGLTSYTVLLPEAAALDALASRLDGADVQAQRSDSSLTTVDPDGIAVTFTIPA